MVRSKQYHPSFAGSDVEQRVVVQSQSSGRKCGRPARDGSLKQGRGSCVVAGAVPVVDVAGSEIVGIEQAAGVEAVRCVKRMSTLIRRRCSTQLAENAGGTMLSEKAA